MIEYDTNERNKLVASVNLLVCYVFFSAVNFYFRLLWLISRKHSKRDANGAALLGLNIRTTDNEDFLFCSEVRLQIKINLQLWNQ